MNRFIIALILLGSSHGYSQAIFDSILAPSPLAYQYSFVVNEEGEKEIYAVNINDNDSSNSIFRFDENLKITDTLTGADLGRPNGRFSYPFNFNGGLYFFCNGSNASTTYDISIHKVENGVFIDSIAFDLDSIPNSFPNAAKEIDKNTLLLLVNTLESTGPPRFSSRVFLLDSTFQLKQHIKVDLDTLPYLGILRAIHQQNDSLWYLYYYGNQVEFNPLTNKIVSHQALRFFGFDTYKVSRNVHLAMGLTSHPKQPSNVPTSLGFYVIDSLSNILDTIQFNAYADSSLAPTFLNLSSERILSSTRNSIVYDTSNIYLASEGSYSSQGSTNSMYYLFVIKTDINGNEDWRFTWGGSANSVTFNGITATHDEGCAVIGTFMRPNFNRYALIIKLGPNGYVSNVELDAPETVVNFYPNPVKDKLHYSFLPETNDTYFLEIIDMQGKPVLERALENEKGFIPVNLETGFYLYHLKDADGKVQQIGKIVAE